MAYVSTYKRGDEPPIRVAFPEGAAPVIPQSCYVGWYGLREVRCRAINAAAEAIHGALMRAPERDVLASIAAAQLVDDLVCAMGYERVGTEQV